jgi:ATP-binding cassette, subfamily B (MDR/TAP), member 1
VIAIILSFCSGCLFPITGTFVADAINSQAYFKIDEKDNYMRDVYIQCYKFIGAFLFAFFCYFFQAYFGEMVG